MAIRELKKMEKKSYYKSFELLSFENVYEPSDDSVLLADALAETDAKDKTVLDLGCGSGIQGINALALGAARVVFTDINSKALASAKENAKRLGFAKKSSFKKTNLFSALAGKRFDLIIFNPPYAESEEKKWIEVDGGKKGRQLLDKFLAKAKNHLKYFGVLLFVQSSLNGERRTKKILKKHGFSFDVIARKRLFFEELIVFKAGKKN